MSFFDLKFISKKTQAQNSCLGEISIGSFKETIEVPFGYWQKEDYIRHWIDSINFILSNNSIRTALITAINDPEKTRSLLWWPIYKNGNEFIITNQFLMFDQLDKKFDIYNYRDFIPEFRSNNEEGSPLSCWIIDREGLENWVRDIEFRRSARDRK